MSYSELVEQLSQQHDELHGLIAYVDGADYRQQYHPDLSPLGWHYGHIAYTENLWLRDALLGSDILTESDHQLYNPQNTPRHLRGKALAGREILLEQGRLQFNDNIALLKNPPHALCKHPLMKDEYLLKFLLQHHALHLETMNMIITQKYIKEARPNGDGLGLKKASPVHKEALLFEGKHYWIGGKDNWSFDNELPHHQIKIEAFSINRYPVSNAEYLGFIEADGYQNEQYWSAEGWSWRQQTKAAAPDGWRKQDGWFQATPNGYEGLTPDSAVCGVCYYEAQAFARYANARLPHEYEREIADPQLDKNNDAWEWCSNNFHGYPGFNAFPYAEYSAPWFDQHHHVLRGGCRFNKTNFYQRPSFRNFYEKHKRHIFAGIRLVC